MRKVKIIEGRDSKIFKIAGQLVKLEEEAKKLGLFLNDRELLECRKCDLMEDVNSYGFLLTVFKNDPFKDTGLRFKKIKGKENYFQCPNCSNILKLSER